MEYDNTPKTVSYVNLYRYLGKWYDIAHFPVPYESPDAKNVTAFYSLNTDNSIQVRNTEEVMGQKITIIGRAVPVPGSNNSKLKVTFENVGNVGDYWIVKLDDKSYQYSVVTNSDKSCLWILSRRKIIDGDLLQSILTWLLENDYDIDNLVETPHDE